MTAPNLTPAEALECLRDFLAMPYTGFYEKWSSSVQLVAALETLLSEHEAVKAKLAAYEQAEQWQKIAEAMAGQAKWMAEQESKDLLRLAALKEPAAAVPSDEDNARKHWEKKWSEPSDAEIRDSEIARTLRVARYRCEDDDSDVGHAIKAIELLCERIGVKL